MRKCVRFAERMRILSADAASGVHVPVSTRQLLRVAKHISRYPTDVHDAMSRAVLLPFLPSHAREIVLRALHECAIVPDKGLVKSNNIETVCNSFLFVYPPIFLSLWLLTIVCSYYLSICYYRSMCSYFRFALLMGQPSISEEYLNPYAPQHHLLWFLLYYSII